MTPGEIAATAVLIGTGGIIWPRAAWALLTIFAVSYLALGWTPFSGRGL